MYKIVSFGICPFVQRSIITMNYKKVPYEVKYIDLANKPDWFLKISPMGKVPVLETKNGVIFESAVINEYIDEVSDGNLLPSDPYKKAEQRAYIELSSAVIWSYFNTAVAQNEESYLKCKIELENNLTSLLSKFHGPFFRGKEFSLVDTAAIPGLQRILLTENLFEDLKISQENKDKFQDWIQSSNSLKEVEESVPSTFVDDYKSYLVKRNSYIHMRNQPS